MNLKTNYENLSIAKEISNDLLNEWAFNSAIRTKLNNLSSRIEMTLIDLREEMKEGEMENKDVQELLHVELPNLIHRILRKAMLPLPTSERKVEVFIEEIKKITNAECQSALDKFKT